MGAIQSFRVIDKVQSGSQRFRTYAWKWFGNVTELCACCRFPVIRYGQHYSFRDSGQRFPPPSGVAPFRRFSRVVCIFLSKMDTIAKLQRKTSIHKRSSVRTDEEEFKGRAQDSEWKDSAKINNCSLCSKAFTLTFRKHHCRECGGVFCGPCSAYKVVISGTLKRVSLSIAPCTLLTLTDPSFYRSCSLACPATRS